MPKTVRNQFDKYLTYANLTKAHKLSKCGKSSRENIIKFELKREEYLLWLYNSLKNQTYRHGRYKTFYVSEPKLRKIEASRYMDRIVHRWYVDSFLLPNFVPQFIPTSYACIREKGMHLSALDVQKAMRNAKKEWGEYYILKMDVAKYFQNIDKEILLKLVAKKIKDKKIMWLTKEIVYSTQQPVGIPIGNYSSQIFANIYLNEIDQYIKNNLKIKYYFRYMDDSIILYKDKKELKIILQKIQDFLRDNLHLQLNSKTNIFKSKQGVNFCGYQINEYRMKIRRKGKIRLKRKIKKLKQQIKAGEINSAEAKRRICGHMGYLKYANAYTLKNKIFYSN